MVLQQCRISLCSSPHYQRLPLRCWTYARTCQENAKTLFLGSISRADHRQTSGLSGGEEAENSAKNVAGLDLEDFIFYGHRLKVNIVLLAIVTSEGLQELAAAAEW